MHKMSFPLASHQSWHTMKAAQTMQKRSKEKFTVGFPLGEVSIQYA